MESVEATADPQFWGPYLAERQWGTVREDNSYDGNCWEYLSHEEAHKKVYQWGEDGLLGVCDKGGNLCAAPAMWNGQDSILKERLFGLTGPQGCHGEDVKELYYYIDNTVNHTYMKALYKYTLTEFPYQTLIEKNRKKSLKPMKDPEFEILDTGVFDDEYWDIFVEYAKDTAGSLLCQYSVWNRSQKEAELIFLPQFWFRNIWSWPYSDRTRPKPVFRLNSPNCVEAVFKGGRFVIRFHIDDDTNIKLVFTENEDSFTHAQSAVSSPYMKDSFHKYIVEGDESAVCMQAGTKCAAVYKLVVPPGGMKQVRWSMYLSSDVDKCSSDITFEEIFRQRKSEASSLYDRLIPAKRESDEWNMAKQAYAGLLWNKQFYYYNVDLWIKQKPKVTIVTDGGPILTAASNRRLATDKHTIPSTNVVVTQPPSILPASTVTTYRRAWSYLRSFFDIFGLAFLFEQEKSCDRGDEQEENIRNTNWKHLDNHDIISMPDKWEFPWYATWDLAFHMIPLVRIDPQFAMDQLLLLLSDRYMHPNGQLPAYEFDFSDVNPPVHAWACLRVFRTTKDIIFLKKCFHRLLINFTWWINNKETGQNLYTGGFLGMDNISVLDRSKVQDSLLIRQADATGWVAFFSLCMLEICVELAQDDTVYGDLAIKFVCHFLSIATSLNKLIEEGGLWHKNDKFYYDVISERETTPICVQSMVGLVPLFATTYLTSENLAGLELLSSKLNEEILKSSDYVLQCEKGILLTAVPVERQEHLLDRVLCEKEFFSPFGIRSLSKFYEKNPYLFLYNGTKTELTYAPGESDTDLYGGNSNWRGPVWLCMNFLLTESFETCGKFIGHLYRPKFSRLQNVAKDISQRIVSVFVPNSEGQRPVHGDVERYASDQHWKDLILFYEYFHGDTGKGLGASHQTGWSSLVIEFLHKIRD